MSLLLYVPAGAAVYNQPFVFFLWIIHLDQLTKELSSDGFTPKMIHPHSVCTSCHCILNITDLQWQAEDLHLFNFPCSKAEVRKKGGKTQRQKGCGETAVIPEDCVGCCCWLPVFHSVTCESQMVMPSSFSLQVCLMSENCFKIHGQDFSEYSDGSADPADGRGQLVYLTSCQMKHGGLSLLIHIDTRTYTQTHVSWLSINPAPLASGLLASIYLCVNPLLLHNLPLPSSLFSCMLSLLLLPCPLSKPVGCSLIPAAFLHDLLEYKVLYSMDFWVVLALQCKEPGRMPEPRGPYIVWPFLSPSPPVIVRCLSISPSPPSND